MLVRLHWKRLEPSLPDMPASIVMPMIATHVRRHQPLHPPAEISVFMRPQNHVKMVVHQTVPCQSHGHLLMSLPHEIHKRREVIIFVKHITATIAPVEDMVNKSTL